MDFQKALLRTNRFLASVEALIKATEAETTAESAEAYSAAYAAFLDECRKVEPIADDLEDIGFAGPISPDPRDRTLVYYRQKPYAIIEAGKLVGGNAFVWVEWLKTLKESVEKARKWLEARERKVQTQDDDQKPALDDEDEKILRDLAKFPLRLFVLVDFSVSNKTAGRRVNAMIKRGWATRPNGKNGGVQITPAGFEVAKQAGLIDQK